jgi:hypothetical protein
MKIYHIVGELEYFQACCCEHCKGHTQIKSIEQGVRANRPNIASKKCIEGFKKVLMNPTVKWAEEPKIEIVKFKKAGLAL